MRRQSLAISWILVIIGVCGCAPTPMTLELDPRTHETVLVYPVFDGRKNKNINLLFDGGVNIQNNPLSSYFMAANFGCIIRNASDVGITPNASYADFLNETDQLRQLNKNDERYVLAIYLGELGWKSGSSAVASVAGFLVDTETGEVVWSNTAEDGEWAGLLPLRRAMYSGDTNSNNPIWSVWNNSMTDLVGTFPNMRKRQGEQDPK